MHATEKTPPAVSPPEPRSDPKWPHLIILHGAGVSDVHRVEAASACPFARACHPQAVTRGDTSHPSVGPTGRKPRRFGRGRLARPLLNAVWPVSAPAQ
jgi:hypothetical protein